MSEDVTPSDKYQVMSTLNSPPSVCPVEVKTSTAPPTDATVSAAEGSIDQRGERTPAREKASPCSSCARPSAPAPRPST